MVVVLLVGPGRGGTGVGLVAQEEERLATDAVMAQKGAEHLPALGHAAGGGRGEQIKMSCLQNKLFHTKYSPCVARVDHEYESVHLVVVLWPDAPEAAATAQVVQANLEALVPGRKKEEK